MSVRAWPRTRTSPDAFSVTSTPARESLSAAAASSGSLAHPATMPSTCSPRLRSASAAATPERASPSTAYGPPGSGGRALPTNAELIDGEAHRAEGCRHDPEAQDDLGFRPRAQLEVVVDRGHQEDALAKQLKRHNLDHDRQCLEHEDPPEQDQQHLGV